MSVMHFWLEWALIVHRAWFFPFYYMLGLEAFPIDLEEELEPSLSTIIVAPTDTTTS